jgi:hypothetical protein
VGITGFQLPSLPLATGPKKFALSPGFSAPDLRLQRTSRSPFTSPKKDSKRTLEIEMLNPKLGYTFDNSDLCCPFCNNAKSNLISEKDWIEFFVPAMKEYFKSILKR